ncbi:MAG: ABC transporter permease [Candidatus Omnitrophota bacterium]|nr:ABC transporter permease [Candidatus Omnitrophota bacterium]
MNNGVYHIPILNLLYLAIPLFILGIIYIRWKLGLRSLLYAVARMVLQLTLIGYVLVFLFATKSPLLVCGALSFMLVMASVIALRPVRGRAHGIFKSIFVSLVTGCGLTLGLVVGGVLHLDPWYEPRYVVPIAGMIFANSMNSVSLTAERFFSERARNTPYEIARNASFEAGLLPTVNSLIAVGLVSFPGMMTGQILAGMDTQIAVRYQIMVMLMILNAAGISCAVFLSLLRQSGK